jgi:tetrahydromethanopterin S-methyltransferase subunit A
MNSVATPEATPDIAEAVRQLGEAASAKKCWHCGCLHGSLRAIGEAIPEKKRPEALGEVMATARSRLRELKYDCLGCEVCFPAVAVNALGVEGDACPSEPVQAREGWPALPGSYTVLRFHAPVAVCTLTDETLMRELVATADSNLAIVGTMQTENLGIERLILNTIANPNVRFLILCGDDSRQVVGHLPGATLLALAGAGVDENLRIIGAPGKRAVLRNINREAIEHFRRTVQMVDLIGEKFAGRVVKTAGSCAKQNPGPAQKYSGVRSIETVAGYLPTKMVSDPNGYFVVFPDRQRRLLLLEHYGNDGVLDVVIEGKSPAEVYIPAAERALVSRLDHAAYLGKELARAEQALEAGVAYVQDAAPEDGSGSKQLPPVAANNLIPGRRKNSGCGCGSCCG